MPQSIEDLRSAEDGSATLDRVRLVVMVIGMLFGALAAISDATADQAALAGQTLDDQEIGGLLE